MATSMRSLNMYQLPCFTSLCGRSSRLHNIGVRLNEMNPESRMAAIIVTENSRNNLPITPPIKRTGIKTAASEIVIDKIVKLISLEPFMAA